MKGLPDQKALLLSIDVFTERGKTTSTSRLFPSLPRRLREENGTER